MKSAAALLLALTLPNCLCIPAELDLKSSLLPMAYPAGDPSQYALPVFLSEPKDSYAAKGSPAILVCKVAHALSAFFVCNDEVMKSAVSSDSLVDPETSIRYTEVKLEVTRSDILDVLGKYTCKCHASSAKGEALSAEVVVRQAYLKKEFETPPYSQQIQEGSQAILHCHPPAGEPPAWVKHWLKNGDIIDPAKDTNFIQNADGHLLLQQARMEDTANYTCVATNPAQQERNSDPALLTIFVPGQWGEWGEWSECNKKCGRGVRKRTRVCDNPSPLNGGPSCEGEAIRKENCNSVCPSVDGAWSSWNSWSSCSADCVQYRHRKCNNPAPKYGGRYCQHGKDGKDQQAQNCTGGMCKPGLNTIVLYGTEPSPPLLDSNNSSTSTSTSDLTLCIGLVFAFLVFIVVVFVIVRLLRRKGGPRDPGYRLSSATDCGNVSSRRHHQLKGNNCYTPPALSHSSSGSNEVPRNSSSPTVCFFDYGFSDKNSNCSSSKRCGDVNQFCQQEIRPISEHLYEQPMVVFPPTTTSRGGSNDSLEKTPFLANPIPLSVDDMSSFNWSHVTAIGARISVPRSAVSLTIPQGALQSPQDLFVSILPDKYHRPQLDGSQAAVTPVVQCGPANITNCLQKPVVLSVPHVIGGGNSGAKRMTVLYCADLEQEESEWEEADAESVYMQVDSTMVHLVTERLGAYVLVASVNELNNIGGGGMPCSSSSGYSSSLGSTPTEEGQQQKLTPSTKLALSRILDVPSCEGKGWQHLAEVMGADHYAAFFATQPSPSEALLSLWEARSHRDAEPLKSLALLLKEIRREDAIVVLERDLKRLSC